MFIVPPLLVRHEEPLFCMGSLGASQAIDYSLRRGAPVKPSLTSLLDEAYNLADQAIRLLVAVVAELLLPCFLLTGRCLRRHSGREWRLWAASYSRQQENTT